MYRRYPPAGGHKSKHLHSIALHSETNRRARDEGKSPTQTMVFNKLTRHLHGALMVMMLEVNESGRMLVVSPA